jgi:hypothetical protein
MSKTRMFHTKFWSDPWVVDQLDMLEAHLYFYLMTNEHTNIAVVYEISLRTIASEAKIERQEVARMLNGRLGAKVRYFDGWLILKNFIKHQNYQNQKIRRGIELALADVPAEALDYIHWPADYGQPKPEGSQQTQLLAADELTEFDESKAEPRGKSAKKCVKAYNKGVPNCTTTTPVRCLMDRTSHSDSDSDVLPNPKGLANTLRPERKKSAEAKAAADKPPGVKEHKELVSGLYYQVIGALDLPVRNHNTVRAKIAEMSADPQDEKIVGYLEFLRDEFSQQDWDYKPSLNEALDIFTKRIQIGNTLKRSINEQARRQNEIVGGIL